jgi:glycosyltransferase involved in cell wall biosynthesis
LNGVLLFLVFLPFLLLGYATFGYPAALWIMSRRKDRREPVSSVGGEWPSVTITVPAFNEAGSIAATLESLLQLEYPADKRQILVLSDASTDGTDDIVGTFASRGVDLVRLEVRSGKTVVENTAFEHAKGELIVNVDATVRVLPTALKPLVAAFADPTVGVASGRDVSVGDSVSDKISHEGSYVGYEMWVRDLETRILSIVGASGCFYATKKALYSRQFPGRLSRDFASALIAREHGFRAVSVPEAVCLVPRGKSLAGELRRKTRTMTRGLATLQHMQHLLDLESHGLFSWMLASHKLSRWLVYASLPFAIAALVALSASHGAARLVLAAGGVVCVAGILGLVWPQRRELPRPLALAAYTTVTLFAGILAWWRFLNEEVDAVWEPTRRTP